MTELSNHMDFIIDNESLPKTANYEMLIAPSAFPQSGNDDVYHVVNSHTGVSEAESTYLPKAIATMAALESSLQNEITKFIEWQEEISDSDEEEGGDPPDNVTPLH